MPRPEVSRSRPGCASGGRQAATKASGELNPGVATFWVQRIVPARYWEASRARAATRTALLLWGALLVAFLLYIQFGTDRV